MFIKSKVTKKNAVKEKKLLTCKEKRIGKASRDIRSDATFDKELEGDELLS